MPAGGSVVAGQFLPGGTIVSVSNYALHHNPAIFGADVDRFRPERFLEGKKGLDAFLMPFGAGHRGCVGRNIASTEIVKTAATLLRSYSFAPLDPHERLVTKSVGVVDKVGGLPVLVQRRTRV